jgi:Ran GTPase-activating protein (RanGAP) involved in mRNA processing and transport
MASVAPLPPWLEHLCQRLELYSKNTEKTRCLVPHHRPPTGTTTSTQDATCIISNLNLNLRRFDHRMMKALVNALEQNTQIQVINMTSSLVYSANNNNTAGIDQTLLLLAELLQHHPSLQVIHLSYNRLSNADCLGQTLSTNTCILQELYLDHNQLSPESAVSLAEGLTMASARNNNKNTQLQVLCLNSNRIGDVGGEALGRLLQTNTSLKRLQLANNRLGPRSALALWEALEQHSNVTLIELRLDENPLLLAQSTVRASRIQQLVRANQVGRYLLQHDEPTPPVGLWPLVLEGLEADAQYYFLQEFPTLV